MKAIRFTDDINVNLLCPTIPLMRWLLSCRSCNSVVSIITCLKPTSIKLFGYERQHVVRIVSKSDRMFGEFFFFSSILRPNS